MRHLWLHHKIVPRGKHSFLNAARCLLGEQGKTTKIVHRTPMGQETYQQLSHDSAKWPPSLLAYLESGSLLTCGYTPLNKGPHLRLWKYQKGHSYSVPLVFGNISLAQVSLGKVG